MNREIYEEIMAPRRRLWEKGGWTLHGVCEYLRRCEAERKVRRAAGRRPTGAPSGMESGSARKGAEGE